MTCKLRAAVLLALAGTLLPAASGRAAVTVTQHKLTASDPARYANFGYDVDISGSTAIVGAIQANREAGAVYVFVRSGSIWKQQAKLVPPDAYDSQYFGASVAVSGNTAAVGTSDGNVYVYVRADGRWRLQRELFTPDSWHVALSGSTLVTTGGYVYTRSTTVWRLTAHLIPDLGYTPAGPLDVSGPMVVLSTTQGPAVVFRHDPETGWTQDVRLGPPAGATSPEVGIAGSRVVVCAPGFGAGAFWRHPEGGWDGQGTLTVPGLAAYNEVGASCAINGTTAVLGATGRLGHSGALEVFHLGSAGVWSFSGELHPASLQQNDELGFTVALSGPLTVTGSTLIGGAPFADGAIGSNSGAAFTFTH